MTSTLTERSVRKLKPRTGAYYISDSTIKGLQIRVAEDGSKSWSVRYRVGKRQRRLTLGDAAVIPLGDSKKEKKLKGARTLAREALQQVANYVDPAEAKQQRREADTVGDFAQTYINEHAKPKKKSWRTDQQYLTHEVLPTWKHKSMRAITPYDVHTLIDKIAKRPAPILANRVRALLCKMFNVAIIRDAKEGRPGPLVLNPVMRTERLGVEQQRDRVLTHDEIRRFWTACEAMPVEMAAAWKLRLVTAQRAGEVHNAPWSEMDLSGGWWTIPKRRAKNKLAHRVPLSAMALEILTMLHARTDAQPDDYILAGARGKRQQAEAAGAFNIKDFRGHDLRRTAASLMTGAGVSRLVVAMILNHAESEVTAVYDRHSYDNEKRIALDHWARVLTAIIEQEDTANVVAFVRS